jgi:signal peptidase I
MPETAVNPLKSYNVPFDSMEPAITIGSDVLGDVSYYSKHEPKRWDVVVFLAPEVKKTASASGRYIKRIIGLPGETIHLTPKGLKINGAMMAIPPTLKDRFSSFTKNEEHKFGSDPYKIPADSVFVIGDNPQVYVADSRELGPIPVRNLEARVLASVRITPIT